MKAFEYRGKKYITMEIIDGYIYDKRIKKNIATRVPKQIGGSNFVHIPCNEAVKYGLKNFNYARGINLYPTDTVVKMFNKNRGYYINKVDIDQLISDIKQNNVRNIYSEKKKEVIRIEPAIPTILNNMRDFAFDEVYSLVDRLSEIQMSALNQLQDENRELKDSIMKLSEKLDSLLQQNSKTEDIKEVSVFDTPIILKENPSYEEWKSGINRACDLIIKIKPSKTKSDILHEAYNRIRSQYGIVWEQEAKEFKNEFERSPVNTRELCWWIETTKKNYKDLLIGKLNTIYSEAKRGM